METGDQTVWNLNNPQNNSLYFRVSQFFDDSAFSGLDRSNYFSVILVLNGSAEFLLDLNAVVLSANSLITLSPYQPVNIRCIETCGGYMINFHADFFCLHKHRNEVSCNGVLFNNIYKTPVISLTSAEVQALTHVVSGIITEMQQPVSAAYEILLSYLKILLIAASRMKVARREPQDFPAGIVPGILDTLKTAIEQKFRTLHSPGEYAALLNSSTALLNRAAKAYFHKTLSQLIADRVILEAKRELYLTSKPVKLIAYELGFNDEFYFSRYFKNKLKISPQFFRDTVGFNRANS